MPKARPDASLQENDLERRRGLGNQYIGLIGSPETGIPLNPTRLARVSILTSSKARQLLASYLRASKKHLSFKFNIHVYIYIYIYLFVYMLVEVFTYTHNNVT